MPKIPFKIISPKSGFRVVPISKKICDLFVKQKHYSHRASVFWKGFGLIEKRKVVGVCVYGMPMPSLSKHAFIERDFQLYELTRLVIQTSSKNAASYLVGNSLKMLNLPCAVVSYADMEQRHCGIVYQATNWIYTGATVSHDYLYLIKGVRTHPMALRDQGINDPMRWAIEYGIEIVKPFEKHRYFYFCGNKQQKKAMLEKLKYPVITPYPKCEKKRYDDGESIDISYEGLS